MTKNFPPPTDAEVERAPTGLIGELDAAVRENIAWVRVDGSCPSPSQRYLDALIAIERQLQPAGRAQDSARLDWVLEEAMTTWHRPGDHPDTDTYLWDRAMIDAAMSSVRSTAPAPAVSAPQSGTAPRDER